jgi:hypothetical protein
MALFGITAREWREANADKTGNIRDYADISQLVCLSNLKKPKMPCLSTRIFRSTNGFLKLNTIAIHQMRLLTDDAGIRKIGKKQMGKDGFSGSEFHKNDEESSIRFVIKSPCFRLIPVEGA